jgi:hypothetical protein
MSNSGAGAPLVSLWRDGAVRPLEEAGTHRSASQVIALRRRNPRPLGGEDVNCQNHALVYIEDLQVRNISRHSKGTIEQPGKKVRQKSGLNHAILDQGWGEFRRHLGYKIARNGGILLTVPLYHTSQTYPA